jgi:perosamine synthetase
LDEVARRITPRTKAILAVDFAGHPAELDALMALADRKGLVFIEDAAHALGAQYRDRRVGSIAHMTVFSFHPVKHITTGEGGMVTTDDPERASRLRLFRNHGISSDARDRQLRGHWHYEMIELGFNYRLTDIGSALGLSQLRRLEANVARRRAIAGEYRAALSALVTTPSERPEARSSWHLYPIRLELSRLRATRAQVFEALRGENLGVNVHYIPVHLHPYYRRRLGDQRGQFPVAEAAYESMISLPLFHGMSNGEVADVIAAVRKVVEYYRM